MNIIRFFLKTVAIFTLITGLLMLLIGNYLWALIFVALGIFLFRAKVNKTAKLQDNESSTVSQNKTINNFKFVAPKKYDNHFYFNVVGISKKNDKGEDVQKLIKQFVADEIEYHGVDKYDGMTNKEILEYGEDVCEVDIYGYDEITLEPEPDNLYDPNAIKVIHEEIGHIGYVPQDFTSRTMTALKKDYNIEWKLIGGKRKYIDHNEDKVRTETRNYGVVIDIFYN